MRNRFSSRGLLAMVTAVLVALLGVGMGAGCDKDARAQGNNSGGVDTVPVGGGPVGGGPADEPEDNAGTPIRPAEKPTERPDERPDERPPTTDRDLGEDDTLDQPGPVDVPDEGESTPPEGHDSGEENAPDPENWRVPVQGSGGDDPPDYIVPSDPKHV